MNLNFFKRKPGTDDAPAAGGEAARRDPRKAKRFFEHAQTVADARNYDYAIDCFISGLRHDPDNMAKHEALHEVARKRKVAGGKKASLAEQYKSVGKDPIERLLQAELLWAKDPLNVDATLAAMERACEAADAEPDLSLGDVAYWMGERALEQNQHSRAPKRKAFIKACDLYERLGAFAQAVQACRLALSMDDSDGKLVARLRDLEAERTLQEGGYGADADKGKGFHKSVRNMDDQRMLDQEGRIVQTASALDQLIERYRAEFDEEPQDLNRLKKLVDALRKKETDDAEDEAITLLERAHESTGEYRHRMEIGNIRMKQFARHARRLKERLDAAPPDEAETIKHDYQQLRAKAAQYELTEFTDRVNNYPTDMGYRYELGKRLFMFKKYDEAIAAFQEAQSDPKRRASSLHYLGLSYVAKGWLDEAINTFDAGIKHHPLNDDRLALDLRYCLMDVLEKAAVANEDVAQAERAREVASAVLQADIRFRDIRERLDHLRTTVDELRRKARAGA